jgi:DNA-binding XRE family transcriptional regulator
MAESFVDTFKTELIADRVWRTRSQLELAVVEYVAWFNNDRLHESLGDVSPAEFEDLYVPQGGPTEHISLNWKPTRTVSVKPGLAHYEAPARIVSMRRGSLGLTQAELAARMGTTASAISRIESGQHVTSARTLKKLGNALGARAVLGFEFGSAEHPERELVVL